MTLIINAVYQNNISELERVLFYYEKFVTSDLNT